MECPEIRDLAVFAETQTAPELLVGHIQKCDACQEALQMLEEEVFSLQIPLSEIWFREHISCPHLDVLSAYAEGSLDSEADDYVRFHVEDLECAWCQGRLGEAEVSMTREGRTGVRKSRKRVGEATSVLLKDLRHDRGA